MAVTKGSAGVVKIGAVTVGEVKSYSLDQTSNTINTTSLGDSAQTYVGGTTDFSGSADVFWDPDDSGQAAVTVGSTVTLNLYPEGTASGAAFYSGSVVVTSISRSAGIDGTVDATLSFQGTGGLANTTV